jgi:glycerol-3-phosphate acyltransferase PlsX
MLGKAYYRALFNETPNFGLLNMASEKGKGPTHLKACYEKLSYDPNFIGNVEPDTIFKGDCPLVLTDGFTGNIFLKTAEAVAQMTLGEKIEDSPFNPQAYPGAVLCGADRLVLKVHGKGDTRALQKTLQEAVALLKGDFLTRVKNEISALKEESI